MSRYIRFDWAIKRMLRDKANHEVLEGLLESLLGEKFTIEEFLESEGNKESDNDKFNRVDILAKDTAGHFFIFEIQNDRELSYFHRILYGTSKVISQYIHRGEDYAKVKKVYSISIVYFDLGQGDDYVYHGTTEFRGLHSDSVLRLSARQNAEFFGDEGSQRTVGAIFPEYYLLQVNNFDEIAKTPLDEWIDFLKTDEVKPSASAPGLAKVRECMRYDSLSDDEKAAYDRHLDALQYQRSVIETSRIEGRAEGRVEGRAEGRAEGIVKGRAEGDKNARLSIACNMKKAGIDIPTISVMTNLSIEEIINL